MGAYFIYIAGPPHLRSYQARQLWARSSASSPGFHPQFFNFSKIQHLTFSNRIDMGNTRKVFLSKQADWKNLAVICADQSNSFPVSLFAERNLALICHDYTVWKLRCWIYEKLKNWGWKPGLEAEPRAHNCRAWSLGMLVTNDESLPRYGIVMLMKVIGWCVSPPI